MLADTLINSNSLALFAIAVWTMGMKALSTDLVQRTLRWLEITQRERAPMKILQLSPIPQTEMTQLATTPPSTLKADLERHAEPQWGDSNDITVLIPPILTTCLVKDLEFLLNDRSDSISRERTDK